MLLKLVFYSETAMDTPDALDITSDISSDSNFAASVDSLSDSDYTFGNASTVSPDTSDQESVDSAEQYDWENSYEWLLEEEHNQQPGQPSGLVVISPSNLNVSLEVLGDAVRSGESVTRYFVRIEAENRDDGNGREE